MGIGIIVVDECNYGGGRRAAAAAATLGQKGGWEWGATANKRTRIL
jgi:hypothetical protein